VAKRDLLGEIASGPSIEGVQYLRAIAALMVVFHHARWFLPADSVLRTVAWAQSGARGVDIFFVISGFVMAHSTRGYDPDAPRAPQALAFLVKRLIRVVPFYWIAVLWDAKKMLWRGQEDLDLAKDFLFVPHFNDHGHGMIWPHLFQGWTINYEMFFYALFALSMLAGRRRLVFLTLGLLVLTLVGALSDLTHLSSTSAAFRFYTSSLLLEFAMGVGLNVLMTWRPVRPSRLLAAAVALASFVALLLVPVTDETRGPVCGVLAVAIVWSTIHWAAGTDLVWLRRLGDASYSIYLFHMAFLGPASRLFPLLRLGKNTAVDVGASLIVELGVASLLGLALHYAVEKRLLDRLRVLTAGAQVAHRRASYSYAAPPRIPAP
jgi:exopolysaccharide production protein ExoZ